MGGASDLLYCAGLIRVNNEFTTTDTILKNGDLISNLVHRFVFSSMYVTLPLLTDACGLVTSLLYGPDLFGSSTTDACLGTMAKRSWWRNQDRCQYAPQLVGMPLAHQTLPLDPFHRSVSLQHSPFHPQIRL